MIEDQKYSHYSKMLQIWPSILRGKKQIRANIASIDMLKFLKGESALADKSSESSKQNFFSKGGALAAHKLKLFLNSISKNEILIEPKEFDQYINPKEGYFGQIAKELIPEWINYNYNDLYYTWLLFINNNKIIN